jgi:lycopene beta-cyclase
MGSESSSTAADLLLVGGGLQNALIALAVLDAHPNAAVTLLEAENAVLGNHTWCVHAGDVPASARALVQPWLVTRWSSYDVRFPGFARTVSEPYAAITSEHLRAIVEQRFNACSQAKLITGARAKVVSAQHVELQDGRTFGGRTVVDARGPSERGFAARAFQKFVGLEFSLAQPTSLRHPILMDATVPQTDGFRFFYVLPLDAHRVLVEDTYFSDSPELDEQALSDGITAYARDLGLNLSAVTRRERGVLPLPLSSAPFAASSPLAAGYAGGFFHPATGYSFPAALRLAMHIARNVHAPLGADLGPLLAAHRVQFRFGAFLNRLLFSAFRPSDRWNAMARFYRLPNDVIRRFYSLDTTRRDRARILCGRPPRGLSLTTFVSRGACA